MQNRPSPERAVNLNQMAQGPPDTQLFLKRLNARILSTRTAENQRQMLRPVLGAKTYFQEVGTGGRPGSLRPGLGVSEDTSHPPGIHRQRYSFWGR